MEQDTTALPIVLATRTAVLRDLVRFLPVNDALLFCKANNKQTLPVAPSSIPSPCPSSARLRLQLLLLPLSTAPFQWRLQYPLLRFASPVLAQHRRAQPQLALVLPAGQVPQRLLLLRRLLEALERLRVRVRPSSLAPWALLGFSKSRGGPLSDMATAAAPGEYGDRGCYIVKA